MKSLEEVKDRYIVVDFQNTVWKSWMVNPGGEELKTSSGYPTGHVFRFLRTIYKWKRDFSGEVVFCYEGGEKRRYELFPSYKAGRSKDREFDPAPDVRRLVSHLKCIEIKPVEAEADDAIAAWVYRKPEARHLILSSDKDLWACRGSNVDIVSFQDILTDDDIRKSCTKHYGSPSPKSITLAKALFGDKSDGLPSVPRLMKKHVAKAVERAENPDQLFSDLGGMPQQTAEKLRAHESQIRDMYEVVRLRKEVRLKKRVREGDAQGLKSFLREFECTSLLPTVPFLTS